MLLVGIDQQAVEARVSDRPLGGFPQLDLWLFPGGSPGRTIRSSAKRRQRLLFADAELECGHMALSAWTRAQLDKLPTLGDGALQELDDQLTSDYELDHALELTPDVVAELTELAAAIESVSKELSARKAHQPPEVAQSAGIAVVLNAPVAPLDSHVEASAIAPPTTVPASPPPAPPAPSAPPAPPADEVMPQAQPPDTTHSRLFVLIGAGVAFVAIIAIVLVLTLRGSESSDNITTPASPAPTSPVCTSGEGFTYSVGACVTGSGSADIGPFTTPGLWGFNVASTASADGADCGLVVAVTDEASGVTSLYAMVGHGSGTVPARPSGSTGTFPWRISINNQQCSWTLTFS